MSQDRPTPPQPPHPGADTPVPITRPAPPAAPSVHAGEASLVPTGPDAGEAASTEERYLFAPPIDIYETDEGLVLEADLPGVTSDTLELQIQDNKLTLFGRVVPQAPEGALLRHAEYGVGDYLRSFILSDEVDHERISARLTSGVLRVVLPKAARARPRRIEIATE